MDCFLGHFSFKSKWTGLDEFLIFVMEEIRTINKKEINRGHTIMMVMKHFIVTLA